MHPFRVLPLSLLYIRETIPIHLPYLDLPFLASHLQTFLAACCNFLFVLRCALSFIKCVNLMLIPALGALLLPRKKKTKGYNYPCFMQGGVLINNATQFLTSYYSVL